MHRHAVSGIYILKKLQRQGEVSLDELLKTLHIKIGGIAGLRVANSACD